MQEYMDSMHHYLGASCEVLKLDNRLLFAGSIRHYDDGEEELTVSIRNGSETPQGIIHQTPVKLHIQTGIAMDNVLLVYGVVSRCAADFWRIALKHTFSCAERRSSFRQPIRSQIAVYRGIDAESSTVTLCQTVDVSLTGLCLISPEQYVQGEQIYISSLQLRRDGPIYSFGCTVQRVQPLDSGKTSYGCSFNDITERQGDMLFHDMFLLQVKAINRK